MIALLAKGGVLMVPILFCSVLALGLIIEKLLYFRRAGSDTETLKREIALHLKNNRIKEAISVCKKNKGVIPQIFRVALENEAEAIGDLKWEEENDVETTRKAVSEEIQLNCIPHLEKHLNILDSLARGTPLLGLLGTVVGMIRLFGAISRTGLGEPDALAGGIGIALITTAAGLTVAIPAFFAHSYFTSQVDHFVLEIEKAVAWLLRQLEMRSLIAKSIQFKESGE
ncbi:MotA/TolQ/ExbB proton channel family protein [bacterium]|nr:MotA/TolQ/ExbB proton channel family protein [bacterium]